MYVMSSLAKSQQSVAGGLFQTVTKLCITIGMGISTAIFDSVVKSSDTSGLHAHDPIQPYSSVFWFSAACAGVSILLVPFLTITTQGHRQKDSENSVEPRDISTSKFAQNTAREEKVVSSEDRNIKIALA
jgi:hypothetical protein